MKRNFRKGIYSISADKNKLDVSVIHQFLTNSYWAKGRTLRTTMSAIKGSTCFGLFCKKRQIGFARIISDNTTYAYLCDVFILEEFRGRGLSKWLMEVILNYGEFRTVKRWFLATRDAHGLYKKFGFVPIRNPEKFMEMSVKT